MDPINSLPKELIPGILGQVCRNHLKQNLINFIEIYKVSLVSKSWHSIISSFLNESYRSFQKEFNISFTELVTNPKLRKIKLFERDRGEEISSYFSDIDLKINNSLNILFLNLHSPKEICQKRGRIEFILENTNSKNEMFVISLIKKEELESTILLQATNDKTLGLNFDEKMESSQVPELLKVIKRDNIKFSMNIPIQLPKLFSEFLRDSFSFTFNRITDKIISLPRPENEADNSIPSIYKTALIFLTAFFGARLLHLYYSKK